MKRGIVGLIIMLVLFMPVACGKGTAPVTSPAMPNVTSPSRVPPTVTNVTAAAPTIPPPFNPLHGKGSPPPIGIGGWEKPRSLTDNEKARVVEIAINISASAWLKGRTDYRVSDVGWYAAVWNGNDTVAQWVCSYGILDTGIPSYVNPYAYWYPAVTIATGQQGNIVLMQIAVNLDNNSTAFVDGPYPPPGQITVTPPT